MSITANRAQRRRLAKDSAKLPRNLQLILREEWPEDYQHSRTLLRVWRSRDYLVQEYEAPAPAIARLSVLRSTLDPSTGRWVDGITWEELQWVKNAVGYVNHDAVEIYPAAKDVVNVANLRHLWVMQEKLPFAWR